MYQFGGPWTLVGIFLYVSYATINVFLVFFRKQSLADAGSRAGELALINLIFPLSTIHLSYLADLLGITWRTCCRIHPVQMRGFSFSFHESANLFTMLGAISLGILALLAIPWFRHQRHFPSIYLFIALSIFAFTSFLQLVTFLYFNGLLAGRGCPKALVSFSVREAKEDSSAVTAIRIRILLPRSVKVQAGQYINLWMPSVSLRSWMQTHPFTVTSWSRDHQDTMELLVQPRHGLTADLLRYAPAAAESSISFLAFFTGPHGIRFGIATVIPYLKKMIYGYNTCTSQVRRLHLVWQVELISEIITAQDLLNNLLKDDIMDNSYIFNILIYVASGLEKVISYEASREQIERLPNIQDK
ncbi:hypothetical protein BDV37DRAFT_270400 [Aspergillus pseudonomiae]|uniref:ferric-chelate reductase (NADPH) n=1 Tax=Aspergillus pseudonomiae TaxID=1506151 RepID=A0A5N7DHL2_9EURO|nr:uncharacterized protein BDV37DRAFT_270400 [Aspergillus pseudonomiae]KAE8405942.1 hypothetical protein BDV37DRAFT_270400 [Aspergillus pseudonomiae]